MFNNSLKNIIFFLDAFIYYARVIYGNEKGKKIYVYYMENASIISSTMRHNRIICEDYFLEVRHIIQTIECNLFLLGNIIYYIDHPYNLHSKKPVDYNDFLKIKFAFYENRGELLVNVPHPTRLYFLKSIIEPLIKQKIHPYFSKDFPHNNLTIRKEEIHRLLEENNKEIFVKYKKNYRELSRNDFRECVANILQQKDAQHIVDNLWYDIRTDPDHTDKII